MAVSSPPTRARSAELLDARLTSRASSTVTRPVRIAVLSHDEAWPEHSYNRTFVQTMVRELDAQFVDVDRAWPPVISDIADYRSLDAVVTFIRYRQLLVADPIDWRGYDGVRIQIDHDAHTDPVLA